MYACGLVLWEVASRCNLAEAPAAQPYRSLQVKKRQKLSAFCCCLLKGRYETQESNKQIPRLPFEAEASPHPSLEEICELVVTKKVLHIVNNQEDNQCQSISALVKNKSRWNYFESNVCRCDPQFQLGGGITLVSPCFVRPSRSAGITMPRWETVFHSAHSTEWAESISGNGVCQYVSMYVITSKMINKTARRLYRPL